MQRSWLIAIFVSAMMVAALAATAAHKSSKGSSAADDRRRAAPAAANKQTPPKGPSHLRIDSGELLSASGMPIHVSQFDALVGGDQKQQTKDGKKAVVTILNGTALLTPEALTHLLKSHMAANSKVRDFQVETQPGKVKIKGKTHKVVDLPFEIEGTVGTTQQGQVKLDITDESLAHLPKGLSKDLGMDPRKMVPSNAGKGIQAEKNSLSFDPDLLWGLPIHGHVTRATLEQRGLLLLFGKDGQTAAAEKQAPAKPHK